jgi:hypothetical protein
MQQYYANIEQGGGSSPSGIEYQRIPPTQVTSYTTGDFGWCVQNGRYSWTDNLNPSYIQELDLTLAASVRFYFLKYDNAFGNKSRFTDINGNGAPSNRLDFDKTPVTGTQYIIDHLTGLGFYTQIITTGGIDTWTTLMDNISTRTDLGYNDWIPITRAIVNTCTEQSSVLNGPGTVNALFYGTSNFVPNFWYGETPTNSTTNAWRMNTAQIAVSAKNTQGLRAYMFRVHYK